MEDEEAFVTLWVLALIDYSAEAFEIHGVYSSKEKALEAKATIVTWHSDDLYLFEIPLDAAPIKRERDITKES